jgi:hypothetical protein
MTHQEKTLQTIQYCDEIIPYYTTANGNVILISESRPAEDEDALLFLIQQQNKKQNTKALKKQSTTR